jgi:hypothetical protein
MLLTQEFHMHQPLFNFKPQEQYLFLIQVFHIFQVLITTQVLQLWTQTLLFGRELLFMTAKYMVRNNTKRMLTIFKLMVKPKKLLQTQEFHMHLHSFKPTKWEDHQSQVLHLYQILVFHILLGLFTIQVLQKWIQMLQFGREEPFMMVKFTVKNNIKRMLTIFKLTVKPKRQLLIQEFHMPQHSFKLTKWVGHQSQVLHLFLTLEFHTLKVLPTIQVPHPWIQMLQFGREEPFTMVKSMVRSSIKRMLTTSKPMAKLKKMLQIQESHMHPLLSKLTKWVDHQSQVLHLSQTLVSHTLKELPITQVPHQWTQMLQFGRELLSMMVRFTVRSNIKKMLTTSKPMAKLKKMLLTQEFHTHLLLSKLSQLKLVRHTLPSAKFH